MSIFDGLVKWWKGEPVKADEIDAPDWGLRTAETEYYQTPSVTTYEAQSDTYRTMANIATGVEMIGNLAAIVKFNVRQRSGEDDRDIPNHPFERLMYRPNPLQSRFMMMFGTVAYYKVCGNAYWWINRPGPDAPPTEIWLIPSNKIVPEPDGNMFLKGYLYYPGDGSEIALDTWEVCHFQRWNPRSMFFGLSQIEAIGTQAYTDKGRLEYDAKLYTKENGRLPSVLAFKAKYNPTQWEELKAQVRDQEKKRQMMLLHGVGDGGVNWLSTAMTSEDAQFVQARQYTKEEIWNLMAPGLASVLAINATEANAKAGKATLMEYAVYPMLEMMAQQITNDILPAYGDELLGEFDDPRTKDIVLEIAQQDSYAKVHTLAETRKKFHQSEPLGDERDNLLLSQITADSGAPEPELEPMQDTQPETQPGELPPMEDIGESEPTPEDVTMALNEWKRRAIYAAKRKLSPDVDFKTRIVPERVQTALHYELAVCETVEQVKAAFDAITPKPIDATGELKRANDLLERALHAA